MNLYDLIDLKKQVLTSKNTESKINLSWKFCKTSQQIGNLLEIL